MHTFCDHIWQINARCVETIVTKQTKKNRTKPTKNGARSFGSLKLDYRKRSPAKMQPSYTPNALQNMWKRNQIKIVANTYALRLSAISPLPDPIYTTTPPCPSPTCALLPHPNIRHDKTFNGFHLDLGQSFFRAGSLTLSYKEEQVQFFWETHFLPISMTMRLCCWAGCLFECDSYIMSVAFSCFFLVSLHHFTHTRLRIYRWSQNAVRKLIIYRRAYYRFLLRYIFFTLFVCHTHFGLVWNSF